MLACIPMSLLHNWLLCYPKMSHTTLILYYHASMLTLQTSFYITCTLVATCMVLGRLECMWQDLYHCLGIFLGIIGQNPSVSKPNLLHVVIFQKNHQFEI